MLASYQTTVDEAIADLEERREGIEDRLDDLDPDTDRAEALEAISDRLGAFLDGLRWQRDEAGWGGDATLEFGAPDAQELAQMEEEMPDDAGTSQRRLWYVAAATVEAPYAEDDLEATFRNLSVHDGFARWAEAQAYDLSVPGGTDTDDEGDEGN